MTKNTPPLVRRKLGSILEVHYVKQEEDRIPRRERLGLALSINRVDKEEEGAHYFVCTDYCGSETALNWECATPDAG